MMNDNDSNRECPKCGAPVPAEAPQGLCPKCVLEGAATAADDSDNAGAAPTATSEIPSLERVARAFPQLEILELIGRGGMGFVFKARQPHLDRLVALKLLPDKLAKDPQFAERFNREGRVLARLNHPNIVSVFDFGRTEHFYYLLMEYVDGVNMRQAMRAGRFSPSEALTVVPKICEALQYAHEQGVLHRDIKPENILLDARGRVKIADFGIAKLVGEDAAHVTLTNTGSALGTPHYMAPEQFEQPGTVDHRADIYSLGVVFYEMLTGELPLGRFDPPSVKSMVDARIDEVVFRTLERKREKRFQSAEEVGTRVEDIRKTPAPKNASASTPPPAGGTEPLGPHGTVPVRTEYSQKAVWGAVLTGLALLLAGGPFLLMTMTGAGFGAFEILLLILPGGVAGIVGTIMGWMALSDIRESRGRRRGLPLAVFAALACPLSLFVPLVLGVPYFLLHEVTAHPGPPRFLGRALALGLPALLILLMAWVVAATGRWASGQARGRRHGVLRWAFLIWLVLVAGLGLASWLNDRKPFHSRFRAGMPFERPPKPPRPPAPHRPQYLFGTLPQPREPAAAAASGSLRMTVTEVDIHEESDAPWLVVQYESQQREDAPLEPVFHWEAQGYRSVMEHDAFNVAETNWPDVRRQNARWRLPETFPREEASAVRETLSQSLLAKSWEARVGGKTPWFKAEFGEHGSLEVALEAKPAARGPAVRLHFTDVELRSDKDGTWLAMVYTEEDLGARLNWGTDGKFPDTPVQLASGTRVNAGQSGEPDAIENHIQLRLPDSMNRETMEIIRALTEEKWRGVTLVVHPTEKHTLFVVPTSGGGQVTVSLEGSLPEPKP